MLFYFVLETTAGTKIIDTTKKLADNVDVSKSSVVVKVRGIRIKSSGLKNKSKSQQHIANVDHEGCYILIHYLYFFMLTYFMLLFVHFLLFSNILFYM